MRTIFCLLLIFISSICRGQLSDDSLKHLCIERFKTEVAIGGNGYLKNELHANNLTADVEELFPGYFKNIRVFRAKYKLIRTQYVIDDDANDFYQIYLQDSKRGKPIRVTDPQDFNALIECNTGLAICNVDKVYLYLFAQGYKPFELVPPKAYRRRMKEKSQFAHRYSDLFRNNCGTCSLGTNAVSEKYMEDCMEQCSARKLVTFLVFQGPSRSETHEVNFSFEKDGVLLKVEENLVIWGGKN